MEYGKKILVWNGRFLVWNGKNFAVWNMEKSFSILFRSMSCLWAAGLQPSLEFSYFVFFKFFLAFIILCLFQNYTLVNRSCAWH